MSFKLEVDEDLSCELCADTTINFCPTCQEAEDDGEDVKCGVTLLQCGHLFHSCCLNEFKIKGRDDCPVCKVKMQIRDEWKTEHSVDSEEAVPHPVDHLVERVPEYQREERDLLEDKFGQLLLGLTRERQGLQRQELAREQLKERAAVWGELPQVIHENRKIVNGQPQPVIWHLTTLIPRPDFDKIVERSNLSHSEQLDILTGHLSRFLIDRDIVICELPKRSPPSYHMVKKDSSKDETNFVELDRKFIRYYHQDPEFDYFMRYLRQYLAGTSRHRRVILARAIWMFNVDQELARSLKAIHKWGRPIKLLLAEIESIIKEEDEEQYEEYGMKYQPEKYTKFEQDDDHVDDFGDFDSDYY